MSWHYSQALEVAYSAENSLVGGQSAPSKSTTMLAASSWPDRTMDASNPSPCGTMSPSSTASRGVAWWISSLVASRAKTYPRRAKARGSMGRGLASGGKCHESLAKFDPASSSWKTRQTLLFGADFESLETLPDWGMTRDGELWALDTPVLRTTATASGYLPTLTVVSCEHPGRHKKKPGQQTCISMELAARDNWPRGGQYSPSHAAWFMGWPDSWTCLDRSATAKFQEWCRSHGIFSDDNS